jgi:hypothetical protein
MRRQRSNGGVTIDERTTEYRTGIRDADRVAVLGIR